MSKMDDNKFSMNGEVVRQLPNTVFKVKLENGVVIECTISGKMRLYYIKLNPGDKVIVEISKYDVTKGRIIRRGIR
ncbi:translation initiation factor IF-1 [Candidatus Calescamantes bacterium]|nr:translation initiation factor IF-1 [bacterium]MCK5224391.1 translation initiation factor IF-1 [Candidatus Calescamantes bacterium]MCK5398390.1 translation initiation factor IF-1 [bacterium]MCK5598424.1 translation initiation factor IF-1 [bacterium]